VRSSGAIDMRRPTASSYAARRLGLGTIILRQLGRRGTSTYPPASRVSRRPFVPDVTTGILVSVQGFSERLCEKPRFANRVPTHRPSRALTRCTKPTSRGIRASATGQAPTGPTFHTVWRVVRQHGEAITRYPEAAGTEPSRRSRHTRQLLAASSSPHAECGQ
jgi:hypothetical protein